MSKKLISYNQSLLLPKTMFQTKDHAQQHIEQLDYNQQFNSKPISSTHYYKFKPHVIGSSQNQSMINQSQILGKDGKGQYQYKYQTEEYKNQHPDQNKMKPKYHIQGQTKTPLLTRKDLYLTDTLKNSLNYQNIHNMQQSGLEFPTQKIYQNPRKVDHYGSIKNQLHKKIYDNNVNLNLNKFSNIGGLQTK